MSLQNSALASCPAPKPKHVANEISGSSIHVDTLVLIFSIQPGKYTTAVHLVLLIISLTLCRYHGILKAADPPPLLDFTWTLIKTS